MKIYKCILGVENWFNSINNYAKEQGITIHHYIVSSGNKEIIEGTRIARFFNKIYASEYLYDGSNNAIWPAVSVNYTNKTQYLFRITKGIYDITDDRINERITDEKKMITFENLIYIGDGMTDVPCMSLIKERNGLSLAVYDNNESRKISEQLLKDKRVTEIAKANYSENEEIFNLVANQIDKISKRAKL